MAARRRALLLLLPAVLLTGCTAAAVPVRTVTVTASPTASVLQAGDAAPWDLHAVCAAESEVSTVVMWRQQQTEAGRLSPAQAEAVLQTVAVQYLEFDQAGLPDPVQRDVKTLVGAAGTLERPTIDLDSTAVRRARNDLTQTCQAAGLTIGVVAQGG